MIQTSTFVSSSCQVRESAMVRTKVQILALCLATFISIGYARPPKRIFSGENASILEIPHQVSLQNPDGSHFCGGTILHAKYILTAAHCILKHELYLKRQLIIDVIVGTNDKLLRTPNNAFRVIRYLTHPRYRRFGSRQNDIAVMKLNRPIPFNNYQKPAKLPVRDPSEFSIVTVSGWGASAYSCSSQTGVVFPQYLQKVESIVLERESCQQRLLGTKIYPGQFCSISEGGPCQGDSGGPVTYNGEVVGISSWGRGCGRNAPEVATRVHHYVTWIAGAILVMDWDLPKPG